jgi:uncharacterized protein (DUF302 family)
VSYTLNKQVDGEFDAVVATTVDALEAEGFGVLCDIDVQGTFAAKLDEDFRRYRILGACNPRLAREALGAEPELGALLPCNVVVDETDERTVTVRAVDPERLLAVAENPALDDVAADVRERFERVLTTVAETG